MGSRENDVKELYSTGDWERTAQLLEQYKIRYVYIGDLENQTYSVNIEIFEQNLPIIFNNQQITVFYKENEQTK